MEPSSKLEQLGHYFHIAGIWLLLAVLTMMLTLLIGDKSNWPQLILTAVVALLLCLVGWLFRQRHRLIVDRRALYTALAEALKQPEESTLSEQQGLALCFAYDSDFFLQTIGDIEKLFAKRKFDYANLKDSLDELGVWGYLDYEDGRNPVGEYDGSPEGYRITKKGENYVRARWPNRGDGQRKKRQREIVRELKRDSRQLG